MDPVIDPKEPSRRVFISYSTSDRHRVDGLERLLVLFGHKVFLDFKRIRLGSRWKDEVKSALDQTDVTLVYWTRSAASSVWVRNEYEYFLAQHPSRPLVPIAGDETPLSEPLKERQAMSFVPVINELLELKRRMEAEGRKKAEIQAAIRQRLEQAGIRLEKSDENKILRFFGIGGWFAWLPAPLVLLEWVWRSIFEAAVKLSAAQIVLVLAAAAASAAITWQVASSRRASDLDRAHKEYAQLERQAQATEEALTNELEVRRNAYTQLQRQATATEAELTSQLKVARNSYADLEREAEARVVALTKQRDSVRNKFSSHALLEVPGIAKPVLLRFVDSTTEKHLFTVQIPSQGDFNFWIPNGSYQIYLAHTDISDKLQQVVSGDVERQLLEEKTEIKVGGVYKLKFEERKNAPKPLSAEDWGRAKPGKKP